MSGNSPNFADSAGETENHWSDLKALFDSALSRPPEERNRYIEQQCGPDSELRSELESLLAAYESTGDFLEKPIASLRSFAEDFSPERSGAHLPATEPLAIVSAGERIGAYQLDRELGRGGMGAVFLATRADGEFQQQVAIKLIRHGWESDFAVRRFRHERQILATLDHPYVARLLDGGTTEAGFPFFVMEYVEGRHVIAFCEERGLDTQARIRLFLRICTAVLYAHERQIIHRDLKPGNILVRADGTPKLLDFGISKIMGGDASLTAADATAAGFRLLTPAYASPEQMRGDPATVRSDVYSLGVILYELLWGERPSLATVQQGSKTKMGAQAAHLSAELRSIVFQAIQWDPDDRYTGVQELADDLELYLKGIAPRANAKTSFQPEKASSPISIAILPLWVPAGLDEESAFLSTGITDALISRLSNVERLSVRPSSATLKYAGERDTARAARELKVKYILEGSIQNLKGSVRVSLQLVYSEASVTVWAAQFDQPANNLIKLEDSIAEEVAAAVLPRLTGEERAQISRGGTRDSKAHEAYLRGRWHWSRSAGDQEELTKALLCFSQAIAMDANYALAHAGLADYYLRLGLWGGLPPAESFAAAMKSAERAIELDGSSGEAHASLGFASWAYKRDFRSAEQHFNLAIIRNHDYGSAHHWFGLLNSARNQPELAIANLERAHQVEPHSPVIVAALGFVHYNARQYQDAIRLLNRAAQDLRKSAVVQEMLAWCHLQLANAGKAMECAQLAVALSSRSPSSLATLAHALSATGDRGGSVVLCEEIEEINRGRYVSGYDRATAYLAAGDVRKTISSLEQAVKDGDWWVSWVGVEPRWDSLRKNIAFLKLAAVVQPIPDRDETTRAFHAPARKRKFAWAASAVLWVAIAAAAFVFWKKAWDRDGRFQNLRITKITANGIATAAVISPNGKYIAYTTGNGADSSLLLRDIAGGKTTNLAPHLKGNIGALDFTARGQAVNFVNFASERPLERNLFTVALSGGEPQRVLGPFSGGGTMTADGTKAATIERTGQTDQLWVHNLKDGTRRAIKTYRYPERFAWVSMPAWSPDGRKIAYAAEQRDSKGFLVRLCEIEVETGRTREVASPRWNWVQHIAWTGDGRDLAVVAQERDFPFRQIWYVPLNGSPVRRIGNDLDNYLSVSMTSDSSQMVSVQVQTESNIYTAPGNNVARPLQVTPGSGRYFDLSWTSDGRILYASDATGSADLWTMNTDGSGQRQVIAGNGRSYAPIMSSDGRNIAFHSNRSGNWQIWCADANGENAKQLSQSSRDGNWPQFTPDSRYVIYHQTDLNGSYNLWRVPVTGGTPERLTSALTMHPAVSAKDGRIASWWSSTVENPRWKIAVFDPAGGSPKQVFTPTANTYSDTTIRWTPSGNAITYLDHAKGVANIWLQPLDGSAPRQLTNFTSGDIYSFDWSKDNKLLYSRGLTTSDVVLVRDSNGKASEAKPSGE